MIHALENILLGQQDPADVLRLATMFSPEDLSAQERDFVSKAWTLMCDYHQKSEYTAYLTDAANGTLLIPQLYLEWSLRSSPMHPRPLPAAFHNSLFAEICIPSLTDFEGRYRRFAKIVATDRYVKKFITEKDSCLALSGKKLVKTFQVPLKQSVNLDLSAVTESDPEPQSVPKPAAPVRPSETTAVPQAPEPKPENLIKPLTVRPETSQPHIIQDRRLAQQELFRIKKFDKDQYRALTRRYIESLSPDEQSILSDLKVRMRKDIFEDQMSQKIIDFMLDNRAVWTSASAPH